jgi:hypothetical protein
MSYKLLSSLLLIVSLSQAENGLIAHWSFDASNADTFYNSAQNDYHVSSPGLKTAKGVLGNALFLSDTLFKPIIKNSATSFLLSQFSIEAWVQIYEDPKVMNREYYQYKILEFTSIDPSRVADGFSLCIKEGGRPDITLGQDSWIECTSPQTLQIKRWYHLTGTCDGHVLRLYINGKLVQQLAYSGTMVAPEANATIGCQIRETSAVFCRYYGLIDELKLYNYALDSSAIVANYIASNPYPDQPRLIAHWSFDSTLYQKFFDVTKNGFDAITTKGSASVTDGLHFNSLNCTEDSSLIVVKNSSVAFNVPQFTIEGWIYSYIDLYNPGSHFNARSIFTTQTWTPSGIAEGFELAVNPDARLQFVMAYPDRNDWNYCVSDSILRPRKWYHVAASYDGASMKIYINGRMAASKTYSGGYKAHHSDAVIGCQMAADSSQWRNWFKGKIDELKLYNYALDPQSIVSIFNDLKQVDDPPFEINFGMKTTFAQPGDTVVMPIYITNFEDFNINACQFTIQFDSSKVDLLSIEKDSGIISSWPLFSWNPITRDSVSIAMAGTSTPINYGEGELVRCIFRIHPSITDHDTCTISINNISIDEAYHLITATSKNGKIIIADNTILYGDVTGNKKVDIFDAQKVLSYVVGSLVLPDSVCCPNFTIAVADVSGNGSITSYDAALIFQHSVGLLPEFPVDQQGQIRLLKKKSAVTTPVAHLSAQIENVANSEMKYTIIGSNLKGFVAGEISIGFNPEVVAPGRGSITTTIRGATLNSKIDVNSKLLKVAIVTNNDIDENDPVQLLSITLPPAQGSADGAFYIQSALLNEGKIPTNIMTTIARPDYSKALSKINNGLKIVTVGTDLKISTTSNGSTTEICIWTLNGKTIINKSFYSHAGTTLSLDRLPQGSYLYKVRTGSTTSKGKFVITY